MGWLDPLPGHLGWYAAGAVAVHSEASRKLAWDTGSLAGRSLWNLGRGGIPAMSRTAIVRGGTMTLGTAAMQTVAAVAIPIAMGYGVSYKIAGKKGVSDFHDFITGGVSPKEYWDAISLKPLRHRILA